MRLLTLLLVSAMAVSCAQNTKKETTTTTTTTTTTEKADSKKAAKGTTTTVSAGATECKSGTDVRTLEVKANGGSHEVIYTKFGEAKSIATGGKDHCEAIKERVKGNLTNSGFTCS